MGPPVFTTLKNNSAVAALLGGDPFRAFPFGEAPEGITQPYVVWQNVGGSPENYVGQVPDADTYALQFDAYALTASGAQAVADAVSRAIEPVAHVVAWVGDGREVDTRLYRVTFLVDWITNRG